MKAILIVEDDPEQLGALGIKVMRILTPAEVAAGVDQYGTIASKYMLVLESMLMEARQEVMDAMGRLPPQEERSCSH